MFIHRYTREFISAQSNFCFVSFPNLISRLFSFWSIHCNLSHRISSYVLLLELVPLGFCFYVKFFCSPCCRLMGFLCSWCCSVDWWKFSLLINCSYCWILRVIRVLLLENWRGGGGWEIQCGCFCGVRVHLRRLEEAIVLFFISMSMI